MAQDEPAMEPRKTRVLFVCQGNTCRSVMAEYIARARFGKTLEPASAGVAAQAAKDAEDAVYTLKTMKIDASGHVPRDVGEVDVGAFDVVVAIGKERAAALRARFPSLPSERLITWEIGDPFGLDLGEYEECARVIQRKVAELSSQWGTS